MVGAPSAVADSFAWLRFVERHETETCHAYTPPIGCQQIILIAAVPTSMRTYQFLGAEELALHGVSPDRPVVVVNRAQQPRRIQVQVSVG